MNVLHKTSEKQLNINHFIKYNSISIFEFQIQFIGIMVNLVKLIEPHNIIIKMTTSLNGDLIQIIKKDAMLFVLPFLP